MTKPDRTLARLFLDSAERLPEHPALEFGGRKLTYRQLSGRALSVARGLLLDDGKSEPPLTGVVARRSVASYVGVLGAILSGHGYVPFSPALPPARLIQMLENSGCRRFYVDETGLDALRTITSHCREALSIVTSSELGSTAIPWLSGHHVVPEGSETLATVLEDRLPGPDSTAYVLYTSGSTGVPKGVEITHESICHYVRVIIDRYAIDSRDRLSQMHELTFDNSAFDLFVAWASGATLCCPTNEQVYEPSSYIRDSQITVLFSVPSVSAGLERHGLLGPNDYPGLRVCVFAGEALPVRLAEKWAAASPRARIENLYGPTEMTVDCTGHHWRVDEPHGSLNGVVSIGKPLPGSEILVVGGALSPVTPGESGELLVTGPQRARGYWNDAEKTAAAFVVPPGRARTYYRTGDRVLEMPNGNLAYLGRIDHQIKVNGHRVELGEIEAALRKASSSNHVAAVGWPASEFGYEGIVAFVEDGVAEASSAILKTLRETLPHYAIPSIRRLTEFPTNASGKIDRAALAALMAELPAAHAESAPADESGSSTLERHILGLFSELLEAPGIGPDDHFFESGGDSILAAKLVRRLGKSLGASLEVIALFRHPTARALSEHLGEVAPESVEEATARPGPSSNTRARDSRTSVRLARKTDLEDLARIWRAGSRNYNLYPMFEELIFRPMFLEIYVELQPTVDHVAAFVVEKNGKIAGYLVGSTDPEDIHKRLRRSLRRALPRTLARYASATVRGGLGRGEHLRFWTAMLGTVGVGPFARPLEGTLGPLRLGCHYQINREHKAQGLVLLLFESWEAHLRARGFPGVEIQSEAAEVAAPLFLGMGFTEHEGWWIKRFD